MKALALFLSMIIAAPSYAGDFSVVGTSKSDDTVTIPKAPAGKNWQWDNDKSKWWQFGEIVGSKPAAKPAPVKAVAQAGYHTHTCPRCATTWGHADGDPSASHTCPKCGTQQWVQDSKSAATAAPATVYTLPGVTSGGCANGNCPNASSTYYPSTSTRGFGIFRR